MERLKPLIDIARQRPYRFLCVCFIYIFFFCVFIYFPKGFSLGMCLDLAWPHLLDLTYLPWHTHFPNLSWLGLTFVTWLDLTWLDVLNFLTWKTSKFWTGCNVGFQKTWQLKSPVEHRQVATILSQLKPVMTWVYINIYNMGMGTEHLGVPNVSLSLSLQIEHSETQKSFDNLSSTTSLPWNHLRSNPFKTCGGKDSLFLHVLLNMFC